ncbi:MAG TPA: MCE family protein [Mycobacteriales bacterium]|nr:MCE family protein [Mycobacteriales bacterium]HVX69549.1 MCE family protein [Mycobacteriales bacterium]
MSRSEARLRVKRRLQGVAFLAVIAALLSLTVLIYNKDLPGQGSDTVTLDASRVGNQLIIPADVKYEGVLVGRVSSVHSDGENATLTLQLSKSLIHSIPGNVLARILPKTLFGEKYVDLIRPSSPVGSLQPGATIQEDRSAVAIELQDVFSKLVPVLRAANPAALSVALSNTAEALAGRGETLGKSLTLIDRYFSQLNQDMPNIQHDISGLADLASNYADAAPDLLGILKHFSVTARTFTVKADPYAQFLAGTTGFADTGASFFKTNGKGLRDLAKYSEGPLNVLSDYSIVLECLPNGLSIFDRERLEHAFGGGELHIDLIPVNSRGEYTQKDHPSLKEFTRAVLPANCYGLPYGNHALHPENSKYPFAPGGNYAQGGYAGSGAATPDATASVFSGSTAGVGSAAEQAEIATLLAEVTGQRPTSDGLADLLLGPMLRGMAVVP